MISAAIKVFYGFLMMSKSNDFYVIPHLARKLNGEISSDISSPYNLLHFKVDRLLLNLLWRLWLNLFISDMLIYIKRSFKSYTTLINKARINWWNKFEPNLLFKLHDFTPAVINIKLNVDLLFITCLEYFAVKWFLTTHTVHATTAFNIISNSHYNYNSLLLNVYFT